MQEDYDLEFQTANSINSDGHWPDEGLNQILFQQSEYCI